MNVGVPVHNTASLMRSSSRVTVPATSVPARTPTDNFSAQPVTPVDNEILTRHLRVGEYINNLPVTSQSAEMLQSDASGSRANLNGVIISPPSYNDVISPNSRIPSVVVDRNSNMRRQLFSL